MKFGDQIRKERESHAWTQEELAQKISVSTQDVIDYEEGRKYPETETLIKLSEVLYIGLDPLVKGSPDLRERITVDGAKDSSHMSAYLRNPWWYLFLVFAFGGWLTWFIPMIIQAFK